MGEEQTIIKKHIATLAEFAAITLSLFLMERRLFLLGPLTLEEDIYEKTISEFVLWFVVLVLLIWLVKQKELQVAYVDAWKKNWPLIALIVFSAFSFIWTVSLPVSFYKVFVLIAASLFAAYMGIRFVPAKLLNILAWFVAIVATLSLLLALINPEAGTSVGFPYYGAWRGIFWTRGRFGSFMAFGNLIFLLQLACLPRKLISLAPNFIYYLLTLALVFLSRSATAIIIVVLCHIVFFIIFAWLKWGRRLNVSHCTALVVFGFVAIALSIANLDFLFGLLNRDTALTGRIPLWEHLLRDVFSQRPVLGYGFGALWDHASFRSLTQAVVGWPYPVLIADNGFLDVLLNLGIVGFVLFLVSFVLAWVRAFQYAISRRTMLGFLFVLIMSYVTVTNLSLSYFFELEFFVWFLLALTLFRTTAQPTNTPAVEKFGEI
jgi:exopolysaccharide production protein ExoQ